MKEKDINTNNNFYVYIYLDPIRPGEYICKTKYTEGWIFEPIYIGKGKNNRKYDHLREAKKYANNLNLKIKGNKLKIGKMRNFLLQNYSFTYPILTIDFLTEEEAFSLENEIIKKLGKIIDGTGPLCNLTDGGAGGDSFKYLSKEKRQKRIKKLSNALKNSNVGKYERTKEIKNKIKNSVSEYYSDKNILKEHSKKTKKGMLCKGVTSEEISKRTKKGMKKVDKNILSYWKGKIQPKSLVRKRIKSIKKINKIKRIFHKQTLIQVYLLNKNLKETKDEYNKRKPNEYLNLTKGAIRYNLICKLKFPIGSKKNFENQIDSPLIKKEFIENYKRKTYTNGDFDK